MLFRTLLHRNDCLGMAASIESVPFLCSRLVKLAVNMPYQYKVRFSPVVLEREHLFLRDKWGISLKTTFTVVDEPVQVIAASLTMSLSAIDLNGAAGR